MQRGMLPRLALPLVLHAAHAYRMPAAPAAVGEKFRRRTTMAAPLMCMSPPPHEAERSDAVAAGEPAVAAGERSDAVAAGERGGLIASGERGGVIAALLLLSVALVTAIAIGLASILGWEIQSTSDNGGIGVPLSSEEVREMQVRSRMASSTSAADGDSSSQRPLSYEEAAEEDALVRVLMGATQRAR